MTNMYVAFVVINIHEMNVQDKAGADFIGIPPKKYISRAGRQKTTEYILGYEHTSRYTMYL